MKTLILGCGPAGLMAAQAVEESTPDGESVQIGILSRKRKSALYGAQYLHSPIIGMGEARPHTVNYQLTGGNSLDYRAKVYGVGWNGTVSPDDMNASHQAWDIRSTYDALWAKWEHAVSDRDVSAYTLKQITNDIKPDLVINTIPRQALCEGSHYFNSTWVWAAGDAPDIGINIGGMFSCPEDTIICNAAESPSWYRKSRVFGHTTVEWPGWIDRVPIGSASRVAKPLNTNCDCGGDILHVGRYGAWQKGVLSDSAYHQAWDRMTELWAQRALF